MAIAEHDRQVVNGFIDNLEDQMVVAPPPWASLLHRCACGAAYCLPLPTHCLLLTHVCSLPCSKIEVRWKYYSTEDPTEPVYIWCWCDVVGVADGVSDKSTPRCSKVLDAGALRVKWAADAKYNEKESFSWLVLRKDKWSKGVQYGWRCVLFIPPILQLHTHCCLL